MKKETLYIFRNSGILKAHSTLAKLLTTKQSNATVKELVINQKKK